MSMPSPRAKARDMSASSSPSTMPVLHLDLPADMQTALLRKSVPIERADQVMEYAHIQRQLEFQRTVRKYLTQILYGCEEPFCTTPMCRSSQLRVKNTPYRPPTILTARMLAYYLATQSDPTSALCPHKLKSDPSYLGFGYDITLHRNSRAGLGTRSNGVTNGDAAPSGQEKADALSSDATQKSFWVQLDSRHTTKKDKLSLGQNLFDTTASIFFYFKNLPDYTAMTCDFMTLGQLEMSAPKMILANGTVPNGKVLSPQHTSPPSKSRNKHDQEHRRGHSSRKKQGPKLQLHGRTQQEDSSHFTAEDKIQRNGPVGSLRQSQSDQNQKSMNGSARPKHTRSIPTIDVHNKKSSSLPDPNSASPLIGTTRTSRKEIRTISTLSIEMMETLIKMTPMPPLGILDGWEASGVTSMCTYDERASSSASSFTNRSLYYVLSDAERLLQSFKDETWANGAESPLPYLVPQSLTRVFRGWSERNGSLIFDSLWHALEALFRPPPELSKEQKSPRLLSAQKISSLETNGDQFHLDGSAMPASQTNRLPNGTSKSYKSKPRNSSSSSEERYLSDSEAAHIVMICIYALTSHVPEGVPDVWHAVRTRFLGVNFKFKQKQANLNLTLEPWVSVVDALEYEPALRLAERLFRAIAARRCFSKILYALRGKYDMDSPVDMTRHAWGDMKGFDLMQIVCQHLREVEKEAAPVKRRGSDENKELGWSISSVFLEWLRTVCIKHWKREPVVNRWSAVGAAMDIMRDLATFAPRCAYPTGWLLYEQSEHDSLGLHPEMFHMPYFFNHLDKTQTSNDFMDYADNPNTIHLLSYISLFSPSERLLYFRTINYSKMFRSYEAAERKRCLHSMLDILTHRNSGLNWRAHQPFKRMFQRYLVLDVRRERALEDCFDQLWGLERNQLYNPLKVRIGALEGEDGVDQGGVTMEFFRVALAEAFDPEKGMFTVDPQTRMTWFKPASPAPLQQFELIGILFSLAVYNGITLPVTFPLIFYKYLLCNRERTLIDLKDGWPDLYRSFRQVLTWDEGDVSDVFGGGFEFTFDNFGKTIRMNMINDLPITSKPPHTDEESVNEGSSVNGQTAAHTTTSHHSESNGIQNSSQVSNEAPLVTNENRDAFVEHYLYWLMQGSVTPQLEAFLGGFRRCLDKKALGLFSPSELRTLVEGHQKVDIQGLRKVVQYEDGYTADHKTIHQFWEVVEQYDDSMKSKLLEFVTASDRVPVSGIESVMFSIVRNGGDTEMLPTSSTCFGKLLLPEFESKEKLRTKLEIALHYAKGFGAV